MEIDLPTFLLGPRAIADLDKSIQREWILTNGLGGYASSTVLGINTRKYHGLLVSAFNPPVDRRVLLAKLDEEVQIGERTYSMGSNEFKNSIHPKGFQFLSSFLLDPFPTYRFSLNSLQLQKTIFMPNGQNATVINYHLLNLNKDKALIRILPLVNSRHFHSVTDKSKLNWSFTQKTFDQRVIIGTTNQTSTLIITATDGQYEADKCEWIEGLFYRNEELRGESSIDDNYAPGQFNLEVLPNEEKKFQIIAVAGQSFGEARDVLSSINRESRNPVALYDMELQRRRISLENFRKSCGDIAIENWLKWLVSASDSFLVNRKSTKGKSVIAGYHWFEDWGRDAMISLPGLTLVKGRFEDAKQILRTFKHYCQNGLIPNRFPDQDGEKPVYNTVDATLWYFNAVFQYLKYTGDLAFVHEELWETLQSIIGHHIRGTANGIRMCSDSLLEHGPQLTWMDALVNNESITSREGKAVEVQALWYNALKIMQLLANHFNQKGKAKKYSSIAEKAKVAFIDKFWNSENACLIDVVGPEGSDCSLRPNQIVVAALDYSLIDEERAKCVVETVWRKLWGIYGLRTLANDDSRYVGRYSGDRFRRDYAYHNGTVWPWLIGPFVTAFLKVRNYEEKWRVFALKSFLQPLFLEETFEAGLGTISEIFDGDFPHKSNGCISQAWSIAEPLRTYVEDVMLRRPKHEKEILGHSFPDQRFYC